jgi:Asp/Glu/hydantoin racemase
MDATIESSGVVTGGRNLYGIPVGMLMLRSRFPRIPGDAGNAATWPFPVQYAIVSRTSPGSIVRDLDVADMLPEFLAAARGLEDAGVDLITTNCGFLVLMQRELQARLRVPLLSSSLLQVPWLAPLLRAGRAIGVLTIERESLTDAHLRAAGIPADSPVVVRGMEEFGGYFTGQILGDRNELDVDRCRREHEAAAQAFAHEHPEVGAIVLECANMPPYADVVRRRSGLPVFDLTTLVRWGAGAVRLSASASA